MNELDRWGIENPHIDFDRSEETLAFETLLTRDGKALLLASNDGRGGSNLYTAAYPDIDIETERSARKQLRNAVKQIVQSVSEHPALQYEVVDMWVTWKLTGEPKGHSFEDTIRAIDAQLRSYEEPIEEGILEEILESEIREKQEFMFVVADRGGKILDTFDTRLDAEEYTLEHGGKLGAGLTIWMKKRGRGQVKPGSVINPEEVKFGAFSDPAKMPCRSLSYPAGGKFTCPRGSKLMKYPGTVCYFCYGADGLYITPTVQLAQDRRMNLLRYAKRFPKRQEEWISGIVSKLSRVRNPYFRWHETGDIQDETHFTMILEVIRRTPHINHWIPTKEQQFIYEWLDEYGEKMLPINVNIRISAGWIGERIRVRAPLTTSSVSDPESGDVVADPGYRCPATWRHEATDGKCQRCRACWVRSAPNVDYLLHTGSKQARKHREYATQRRAGVPRGQIVVPGE
jgi:hypothetical protein